MTTLHRTALIATQTAAQFLELGLQVAQALGLQTTAWQAGDPTRSLYKFLAEALASRDETASIHARSAWLSHCRELAEESGDNSMLVFLALEVYGVEVTEATNATPTITISNTGGGLFSFDAGDLTFKASASDKTYRNTAAVTIAAGETSDPIDLVADEAGSDSSVGVNEIDEMVTSYSGLEIVSSTVGVGVDQPSPAEIETLCRATLGALSPNGPPDAYEYVALTQSLTGPTSINRAHSTHDATDGTVTLYVASASGAASGADVTAVQDAVEEWATPLCVTPTVVSATPITFAVTATISGDDIPAEAEAQIASKLGTLFAATQIGGLVATSKIVHAIHEAVAQVRSVSLSVPAANVQLADSEVAVLGTVTITEA